MKNFATQIASCNMGKIHIGKEEIINAKNLKIYLIESLEDEYDGIIELTAYDLKDLKLQEVILNGAKDNIFGLTISVYYGREKTRELIINKCKIIKGDLFNLDAEKQNEFVESKYCFKFYVHNCRIR